MANEIFFNTDTDTDSKLMWRCLQIRGGDLFMCLKVAMKYVENWQWYIFWLLNKVSIFEAGGDDKAET